MSEVQLTTTKINTTSDLMGAIASGICLIHCIATPFIFVAHASVSEHAHHAHEHGHGSPEWWNVIDYLFLVISLVAIYFTAKNTPVKWMPIALYGCWAVLAFIILNEKFHFFHLDHAAIYFPALALVGLHLYNRNQCECQNEACDVNV